MVEKTAGDVNAGAMAGIDLSDPSLSQRVPTPKPPEDGIATEPHVMVPLSQVAVLVREQVERIMATQGENPEVEALKREIKRLEQEKLDLRLLVNAKQMVDHHNKPGVANESGASTKARYAIIVEEGRDVTDGADVFVQVNGRAYQIRRGVRVEVPPEVVNVLNDAIIGKSYAIMDAQGTPTGMGVRNVRRFPFQLLGRVIDEHGQPIEGAEAPNTRLS